jgi:hypothetical protein
MATYRIAAFEDEAVLLTFDQDAQNRITRIACVNNTDQAVYVTATRTSDGRSVGQRFGPGTTYISVPTGPAQRIDRYWDEQRGAFTGVSFECMYPYP